MILRYPSLLGKIGSRVFSPIGKWFTASRCRDIHANYPHQHLISKVGAGKSKGIVLVRRLLISISVTFFLVLLSNSALQAALPQQVIDLYTTPVTGSVLVSPPPQKMKLVRRFVVDRTAYATITGYTNSFGETGKTPSSRRYGITSTGTHTQQGRTIAVDPKLIPYGSTVHINGNLYTAEDTGGAIHGYAIDMYFEKTNDALQWGRRKLPIEIGHFEDQWVSEE